MLYNFNIVNPSLMKNYTDHNCINYYQGVLPEMPLENFTICNETWTQINNLWTGLNWYDLFRHVYPGQFATNTSESRYRTVNIGGQNKTYKRGFTFQEYVRFLKNKPEFQGEQTLLGDFLSDYVNRPDVRKALNIPDSVQAWQMCSDPIGNNYQMQLEGSKWIYQVLMQYNYKIIFYSGDTDGAVNTFGTRSWIETLNLETKEEWRTWHIDNELAGNLV